MEGVRGSQMQSFAEQLKIEIASVSLLQDRHGGMTEQDTEK